MKAGKDTGNNVLKYAMNINVDGYDIHYRISGEAEKTVVILQGWGTGLEVYDSIAEALKDGYRVVQFDLPGFGKSTEPREAWSVDDYAAFFLHFMGALGIKSASLIGHSYGGRLIIKLAADAAVPFDIEKITLIDSAGVLPIRTLKQRINIRKYKLLKKIFDTKIFYALFPELVDDWRMRQGSEDYRKASPVMRQCLVKAVNEDLTGLLPDIKQDVLLIWGDEDTATPIRDARIMEERIANSGLVVLEGTGHYSFLEQPLKFRSVIRAYYNLKT